MILGEICKLPRPKRNPCLPIGETMILTFLSSIYSRICCSFKSIAIILPFLSKSTPKIDFFSFNLSVIALVVDPGPIK